MKELGELLYRTRVKLPDDRAPHSHELFQALSCPFIVSGFLLVCGGLKGSLLLMRQLFGIMSLKFAALSNELLLVIGS